MEALRLQLQNWVWVGRPEDVPRQGARVVKTGQGPIALFRTGTGEIYALLDRCPHKGGPLSEGIVHGCKVSCPLHGMNVDLRSGEAIAPDVGYVHRFPVRVEDGRLYLGLAALQQGEEAWPTAS
jgi:nitrite reductase (NADH) small subunit